MTLRRKVNYINSHFFLHFFRRVIGLDLKIKKEILNFKQENKKNYKKNKTKSNMRWILMITLLAFCISIVFSLASENIIPNVPMFVGILILILFIVIGILFDMIGVAVTAADEKPFHSMSSKKVPGARVAVFLKRNADKVSSFCNDVVGDVCGIVSGSAGAIISVNVASYFHFSVMIVSLVTTALIAALTIGGKAFGKNTAMKKSNIILYEFAKIVSFVYRPHK